MPSVGKQFPTETAHAGARGANVKACLIDFRELKREMQRKIDASIEKNPPMEEVADQPEPERGIVRVSGPFTVESIPHPGEVSMEVEVETIPVDDASVQVALFSPPAPTAAAAANAGAYVADMIEKLRRTGVHAGKGHKVELRRRKGGASPRWPSGRRAWRRARCSWS